MAKMWVISTQPNSLKNWETMENIKFSNPVKTYKKQHFCKYFVLSQFHVILEIIITKENQGCKYFQNLWFYSWIFYLRIMLGSNNKLGIIKIIVATLDLWKYTKAHIIKDICSHRFLKNEWCVGAHGTWMEISFIKRYYNRNYKFWARLGWNLGLLISTGGK